MVRLAQDFKPIDALYPPEPILAGLGKSACEEVLVQTQTHCFYKPVTIQQATRFRAANPNCSVVAGGTDLGVVYNKRSREMPVALSLGGIVAMQQARVEGGAIMLGGCTPLSVLARIADEHLPELSRFMEWFGSPLIRNAGTVGGNLMTGSPIGDLIPALIALAADIELTGTGGSRSIAIGQFYSGYRQTVSRPDELLTSVRIPLPDVAQMLKLYKVSRRKDLDISAFSAAIYLDRPDRIIQDIRIIFGGVAPTALRLVQTESVLRGHRPTFELFEHAASIATQEVSPISDVRGSAEYRRTLAGNILLKYWHEMFGEQPTMVNEVKSESD